MRKVLGSAVVVLLGLGQSISGWQSPAIGFSLMALGVLCGLVFLISDDRIRQRLPYTVVRRSDLEAVSRQVTPLGGRDGLDQSLQEIEAYLRDVNRTMEEHGFGPNPALASTRRAPVETAIPSLRQSLQGHLRKGRRIRATSSISSDGASGPIEIWEQDAVSLLEDGNRHDLLTRLDAREPVADFARGLVSGPWATRARMDRKLDALSEFIREMPPEGS